MTYQSTNYRARMLLWVALISACAQGNDEVVVVKTPSLAYIVLGCVIAGVAVHKVREFFSSSSDSARLGKVDTDLSTFKKETGENFDAVVATQEALTEGQKKLVNGQLELQGQVAQVDAKVSGARTEIEGIRQITLEIKAETLDIKKRAIQMQQELQKLQEIQDKLTRLGTQSARIEQQIAEMAKAQDITRLELSIAEVNGNVEQAKKMIVTEQGMRRLMREEIELARTTPSSLRLPASSSEPVHYQALTAAQRPLLKQTA